MSRLESAAGIVAVTGCHPVLFEPPSQGDLRELLISEHFDYVDGVRETKDFVSNGAFYDRRSTPKYTKRTHEVLSSLHSKFIVKAGVGVPWVHGINLWSVLQLGLVSPTRERVARMLEDCDVGLHPDVRPWNFVLDGVKCTPIDCTGRIWTHDRQKALKETIDYVLNGGSIE